MFFLKWQVFQKQDQLALVRALHHAQVAVTEIPRTYNGSPRLSIGLTQNANCPHPPTPSPAGEGEQNPCYFLIPLACGRGARGEGSINYA